MKPLAWLSGIALALGIVGVGASFAVPAALLSKAEVVQRIAPHDAETALLLGEKGTEIGQPQEMIIGDPMAFLPGRSPTGARFVDEDYMKSHGVYPLQVKTVQYVSKLVRIGAGIASVGGLLTLIWVRRRAEMISRDRIGEIDLKVPKGNKK